MAASVRELPGHHGSRKVLSRFRMRPAASPESSPFERDKACENPETFDIRLREAIKTLESQILYQIEDWHRERQDNDAPCDIFFAELDVEADSEEDEHQSGPSTCFVDFIADVKDIMNSYYDDYCRELETRFHKELTRVTTKNLHEVMHLRDRLAPWLRAIDLTCSDEDLALYKPLERWSKEQQEIMKEMIEERLRQLLSLEQLRSTANKKGKRKIDESEVQASEPEPEEEDAEDEEEVRQRQKAAREQAMAAAKDKTKNLENECDELERQLAEMRDRYKSAQVRSEEIRKRSKSLSVASDELDQPLPALVPEKKVKSIPVEQKRDIEGGARSARSEEAEQKAIVAAKKAAAEATKAAFDAEFERCKKEALDMNDERWKKEVQGFTAKIKELEEELSALMESREHKEHREQAASVQESRASTKVLSEFSRQIAVEASPENAVPTSPTHPDHDVRHDAVRNWQILRQKVHALGTTGSVFDKLYQDTDLRKARIDETREKRSKEYEEQYNRTFVRHRPFGSVFGHQVDSLKFVSGASAYSSTGSDTLARRTSALEFGSPGATLKTVQSEPQFRVCLGGPLPPFDDWWDSAPQTGASTPQLGSRVLAGIPTHKAKLDTTLSPSEASLLRAGSQKPFRLEQLSANAENQSSDLRSGRTTAGKEPLGRIDGERSHRTNAQYDILKPTLKQVEVHAKLPTALSRMAAEDEESDKETKADAQHENVGAEHEGHTEVHKKKLKIIENADAKLGKGQTAKAKVVAKTKAKAKVKAKAKRSKAIKEDDEDETDGESEEFEDDVDEDDDDDEDNDEDEEKLNDEDDEEEEEGEESSKDDEEGEETEDEEEAIENAHNRKAGKKSKANAKSKTKVSPTIQSRGKSLPVQGKSIKKKPPNA